MYAVRNEGFEPDRYDKDSNGIITVKINGLAVADDIPKKETPVPLPTEDESREGWGNKFEFILAIIGFAVGLGNVWRFPYLAQKNGGGAFIIPYVISLVFMGIPVFFLELAIGQRFRKGPLHVWNKLAPRLTGIGLSSVIVSFLVGCYYNMIVAWCFYYLFISFQKNIPYAECPCVGGTCNATHPVYVPECAKSSATTYYWYRVALNASDSIEESGGLNWKLCLCLLLAWTIIFAITCKGAESMGKVVYFTALFPYVVLIIFFVRAMMLDGASDGIVHMFTPQFEKLAEPETWLDASTQIFYSLGLAFGGLISMSSYNDINNNVVRDALLVSCVNCGTSIFAGIVIFGILGYKANVNYNHCQKEPSSFVAPAQVNGTCDKTYFLNQVAQGPGLTFIAFTEAMSTMSVPQLWSVMFFLMLLTLGIGSMLGTYEAVRTTVVDLKVLPFRKEIVSFILCVISFSFGLLFCQRSGEYWLQMFDSFAANIGLLSIAFFEIIIVVYVYGISNFEKDILFMLGHKPNWYWKIMWMVVSPFLIFVIIVASIYGLASKSITYSPWKSGEAKVVDSEYPSWGVALCFILVVASVIMIPLAAVLVHFDLFRVPGTDEEEKDGELKPIPPSVSTMPLTDNER
ncbi:sodium- and chloride-dependent transporter XTRP3-like [Hydractinia symbiolongicarpus]|uniref:sodium- and chloride-dependent transporter XTRP3-like n=1 Tax=Hydractinia symbiolongicarpus TaxID=13093 RepID=UPI00254B61AF|nr:sodium- and chloride-dependent transporter XTRP3-like [Hydractinia symbiolongicarpus]